MWLRPTLVPATSPTNSNQFEFVGLVAGTKLTRWPGARFSKLPVIIGPVKLFCFPFQMGVSKLLKIIKLRFQLKKQSGLYQRSEITLLLLRLRFKNKIPGPLTYRVFRETGPWAITEAFCLSIVFRHDPGVPVVCASIVHAFFLFVR